MVEHGASVIKAGFQLQILVPIQVPGYSQRLANLSPGRTWLYEKENRI